MAIVVALLSRSQHLSVIFLRSSTLPALTTAAVQAVYDHKSEEIGPGIYRFKAEIGELCSQHGLHSNS